MFKILASRVCQPRLGEFVGRRFYNSFQKLPQQAIVGDDPDSPRIKDLRQGDKVPHVFPKSEFDGRLKNLRQHMAERGLGSVVLTSYHNVNYFSGFFYCSFGRNYALVVTPDDCITVSAEVDGAQPWRYSHADNVSYTDWKRNNFFHTVSALLGNNQGGVGVEFDHVSLEKKAQLEAALPNFRFEDVSEATMYMRMLKSPAEVGLIRNGARIADMAGGVAVDAIKEGVHEHEVALASTAAMVREIASTYPESELRETWTLLQSDINSDGAHNYPTTRRVQKGDIMSLNCFPVISGYFVALERTLFLDHCSDDHLRVWEINCEVHRKGIKLLKPGARCCDVTAELNEIYRKYDMLKYRAIGYGHSLGMLSHYYGREKALEFRDDIETRLAPGMVVSMEPMLTIPQGVPGTGGYREHNIILITEDGAEDLTRFPFGPEHNIIKA